MKKVSYVMAALAAVTMMSLPAFADDMPDGAKVFKKKCKMCHAVSKKKVGPAVVNMNADADVLTGIITNGKKRMPKFGHKLSEEEISAVVAFLQENQNKAE